MNYEEELEKRNEELEKRNEELEKRNEELEKLNSELYKDNDVLEWKAGLRGSTIITVSLPKRKSGEEGRTWEKIIKRVKSSPQTFKKLQQSFKKYFKTSSDGKEIAKSPHLVQYIDRFIKDDDMSGLEYLIKTRMVKKEDIINMLKKM